MSKGIKYKMRGLFNMGLQALPVAERLRIGYLLLMISVRGLRWAMSVLITVKRNNS